MAKYKSDDPDLLLSPFRERVISLLGAMQARGYEPVLFDGLRTPEQALRNAAKGTGVVDSMHLYGVAADIICGQRGWNHPAFFKALGEEAEKLKLTWGGRWKRRDMAHVQGIPVRDQAKLRKLRPEEREAFVRSRLGTL